MGPDDGLQVGGEGCDTVDGTRRILERDLAKAFVSGAGGWLFDFGPVLGGGDSHGLEVSVDVQRLAAPL